MSNLISNKHCKYFLVNITKTNLILVRNPSFTMPNFVMDI